MEASKPKKIVKRKPKKIIAGIRLPNIDSVEDDDVKTILDVDPEFYSIVDGRPIRPDTSINRYKKNVKGVVLNKILRGYLLDECMRIDQEIDREKDIYDTAVRHFEECRYSFDKFLAYDSDKTIVIMRKSDGLARDLTSQREEHKCARYDLAQLKSKVQYLDETLLILLSFESFLHKSSPILWQEKNDVKLDAAHSEIVPINSDIFRKIDIDLVMKRLSELSPPKLYFEAPDQLMEMFEYMEMQNLHFLMKIEELGGEKRRFLNKKDKLRMLLNEELGQFQEKVAEIEEIITWNENREKELEDIFNKILEEKLRYLVSSDTVLQLLVCVEFTYEQLIATNETKQGFLDMTHAIEAEYEDLMFNLSKFDVNVIKNIEKEVYENSEKELKRSKEAHNMLKDVDKLHRRLKSSFEQPYKKQS